uniref:Uncharacterized protein n=1 Tax=Avena sativa TaxID=4498 RepID=A0ACD5YHX1_AVESA
MASTNGSGGGLPTHTAKPPVDGLHREKQQQQRLRRRRGCLCCACLLVTLVLLAVVLLILFLTVLRVRDPTTRLVSTQLVGVAPRLTFPALSIQLNVTLLLTVSVHNPNPASFSFRSGGHTDLTYRGVHVGDAEIDPGRVPSKGDADVKLALTLQADQFVSSADAMAKLISDVEAGSLPLEASTRIPGRVAVFGVFKRHAVAYSDCSFVFGIAELGVRSQQCSDHTKL